MKGITFTVDDCEYERKEKIEPEMTHKQIYLLGLETAEKKDKKNKK